MKKTDFFKQLDRELEEAAPEMSERLKAEPVCTAEPFLGAHAEEEKTGAETEKTPKSKGAGLLRKKKLRAVLAAAAAAVIVCASVLGVLLTGSPDVGPVVRYSCMYISINPALSLTLDDNYRVHKVVGLNADADTLIGDEAFVSSLVSSTASEAAVSIAEQAAKKGYIEVMNDGSGEYNRIGVTLKSSADDGAPENVLAGVKNDLVEYFCENGVYVYVETKAEIGPDAEALVKEYESRPSSYLAWKTETASAEELETLTEQTVYDYAADLLSDALEKYALFEEIESLNEAIKADADNNRQKSYWTLDDTEVNGNVSVLCKKTEKALDKLYVLYGIDFRERSAESLISYTLIYGEYKSSLAAVDVDALRRLEETGINEQTFGGIENLSVRFNYFLFVSNDLLKNIVTEMWSGSSPTAEKLADDVRKLVEDRTNELSEKYSALFSLPREPVSEKSYEEFLERIGK